MPSSPVTTSINNGPTILATCRQTRFNIQATKSTEIDVQGLDLAVLPGVGAESGSGTPVSSSSKAAKNSVDLLSGASLRLKEGVHYALVGKNGTGKSTLLRALAEKLIPGLPTNIQIALLQQTVTQLAKDDPQTSSSSFLDEPTTSTATSGDTSALKFVQNSDRNKRELTRNVGVLTANLNNSEDDRTRLKNYRSFQREELHNRLHEAQKNATLRSGARGATARKELKALESEVEEFEKKLESEEDLESDEIKRDSLAASQLLLELQTQLETYTLEDEEGKARRILVGLGFSEAKMSAPVNTLSGGWRMRCALAVALFQKSDLMILDEPTNFLDLLGIIWLQKYLTELKESTNENDTRRTVVLVSHDRTFVDSICDEVIVLRDQSLQYFAGNLSAYEMDLRSRIKHLTRVQENQDKERERMQKTIAAQVKTGKAQGDENKLRMASSRQKKLDRGAGLMEGTNGRRFKLSRDRQGFHNTKLAAIEIPTLEQGVSMALPPAPDLRFPGALVSLEDVIYAYSRSTDPVLKAVALSIHMGDRVGIMGLNGSGKSTIIKLIVGDLQPTKGVATRHPRLRLGYYSQHAVEELRNKAQSLPAMSALSCLAAETNGDLDEQDMRGLLATLGLQGRIASDVPVSKLSGGQLVRLALALTIWNHPNLLVLDEVTTHLDYYSVTALAEALEEYNGAVLLVSHDRFMVRRVIQGEKAEDDDDEDGSGGGQSDDEQDSSAAPRRRSVYTLRLGKLKLQEEGVEAYERMLEKRAAKLSGE